MKRAARKGGSFLYTENPALGAGFKKAYSYEQKKNSFDTIDEGLVNRV